MTLSLLNPFILFGLAATVLPILIHRITRKKIIEKKFPAVHLLLQSQRIAARPQRLKHLLLLALRILAVIIIVFLIARPVLVRTGFAALLKNGAKVLILDNSMSMGFIEDTGRRYDVAKKAAKEAVEGFGGQVSLIPTVGALKGHGAPWMKPKDVPAALEGVPLSFGRGETISAFKTAYTLMKDIKTPKQILVLSDLARGDWEPFDVTRLGDISDAEVTFVRIGTTERDPNVRIKEVFLADREIVVGVPTLLEVAVSNLSDQPEMPLIQIYLSGDKIDQKSVDLPPGQERKVTFELLMDKPGWIDGEVRLSSDRLKADDVFFFPLNVKKKVRVLVIDGDPKTSLRGSESYFLESALRPGGMDGSPFLTRVITDTEMGKLDLETYDALFILNVPSPDFSRVASFMETGKPVFMFLGDRIIPEDYNQFTLAPWQIGELTDLKERDEKMTFVDSVHVQSELFSRLYDNLKRVSVQTYFKIEGPTEVLLRLKNTDPLFVETNVGKSKLFLFASSADIDWNDFSLNAAYVPLIQGLVKEAVGLTASGIPDGMTVGDTYREEVRPIRITGSEDGPGIVLFSTPAGEMRRGINTPPEESNLSKISEDELNKKFGAIGVKVVDYKEGGLNALQGGRKELWPFLLLLLLVVLACEMIIANGLPIFKHLTPYKQDKRDSQDKRDNLP